MASPLDHPAAVKHQDILAEAAGGEAVRNVQGGFSGTVFLPPDHLVEARVDLVFRHRIQGGRGFVHDDEGGVFVNGSGNGHLLPLSAGEVHTALVIFLPHKGMKSPLHHLRPVRQSRPVQGVPYPFFIGVSASRDVLSHFKGKDPKILKDHGKQVVIGIRVIFPDVRAVHPDAALRRLVQPAEELDEGGLSGAVFPDDRQLPSRIKAEVQVMKHLLFASGIAEGNVVEFHMKPSFLPLLRLFSPLCLLPFQLPEPHIVMTVGRVGADGRDHLHQIRQSLGHLDDARRIGHHASDGDQPKEGAQAREQIDQKADQRCGGAAQELSPGRQGGFRIHLLLHPPGRLVRLPADQLLLSVQPQILLPLCGLKDSHIVLQQAFVRRPLLMSVPDPFSVADIHPEAEIYQPRDHSEQKQAGEPGVQKSFCQRPDPREQRKGDDQGGNDGRKRLQKLLPVVQHQADQAVIRPRVPDGMQQGVCLRLLQMRIVHEKQPSVQKSVLLLIDKIMLLVMDLRQDGAETIAKAFQPERRQRQPQKLRKRSSRIHPVDQKSQKDRCDKGPHAVQQGQSHRADHRFPVARLTIILDQRKLIPYFPIFHVLPPCRSVPRLRLARRFPSVFPKRAAVFPRPSRPERIVPERIVQE